MQNNIFRFGLPFVALAFLLQSCATLTGFQDGRTVGQGTFELTPSLSFTGTPSFQDDTIGLEIPTLYFPTIEIMGTYGITDKFDIYGRLNTVLNLSVGAKYQVIGDQEAPFNLALGAEFGTFGPLPGLGNIQVPVYVSVHPTEKLTIYASPRYVYQFYLDAGGINYLGANGGLMFGSRNKFGIEAGYYRIGTSDASVGVFQIGLGGKFKFGGK